MKVKEHVVASPKRTLFGKRNLKEQPHHERSLIEGIQKMGTLQGYCVDFSKSINKWYEKFSELNEASEELSQCFLRVYRGSKESVESAVVAYSKEVEVTKSSRLRKLQLQVEKFSTELEEYSCGLEVTKESLAIRKKLLSSFNHYDTKCSGLRVKQGKTKGSGKVETLKQKEKIKRNNEKLEHAKSAFFQEHQAVIDSLHYRWDSRFTFQDNFFDKFLTNELKFFEAYTGSLQKVKQKLMEAIKKPRDHSESSPQRDHKEKRDSHTKKTNGE